MRYAVSISPHLSVNVVATHELYNIYLLHSCCSDGFPFQGLPLHSFNMKRSGAGIPTRDPRKELFHTRPRPFQPCWSRFSDLDGEKKAWSVLINYIPCYVAYVQEPINRVIANYLQWSHQSCDYASELIRVLEGKELEYCCAPAPFNFSKSFCESWSIVVDLGPHHRNFRSLKYILSQFRTIFRVFGITETCFITVSYLYYIAVLTEEL